MEKKFLSFILVFAMVFSFGTVLPLQAINIYGWSEAELNGYTQGFVQRANFLIRRDDWQNIPGGSKAPATIVLENYIKEAKIVCNTGDITDMQNFLLDLFGGWDFDRDDFVDPDKPYSEFRKAIMLEGLGEETAYGEKGYWDLLPVIGEVQTTTIDKDGNEVKEIVQIRDYTNPGQYTEDSWNKFREQLNRLKDFMTVVDGWSPYMGATRSEVYHILQDYYSAYDGLEFLPSGQDPEANRLKCLLKEVLDFETREGFSIQKWFDGVTVNTDSAEMKAFQNWLVSAEQLVDNPTATADQLKQYVYTGTLIGDPNDESVLIETPEGEVGVYAGEYTFYYDNMQLAFEQSVMLDTGYRSACDKIYDEAFADYESGRYMEEDWDIFLKAFEEGDDLLSISWSGDVQKTEDQFLSALQKVQSAYYDVLLPTRVNINMETAAEWYWRGQTICETSDRRLYAASGFENLEKYLEQLYGEMTEKPNYIRLNDATEKVQEAIETLVFIGVRGDMDKSGKVTLADVLGIARAVLDGSLDFDGQHIADVTEDGAVNLADVIAAARKALSQ